MADSERRYGPTIDLQGFDLATNLGTHMDTVDEPSRLPLVVLIALVVLAAFAGVVWLAYTQGVERGRESVSKELTAQEFWKLRKPDQPAYTGLKIYEQPTAADQNQHGNVAAPAKPKVAPRIANAVPSLRPTTPAAADNSAPHVTAGVSHPLATGNKNATAAATGPGEPLQRLATRAPTELTRPAAPPPPTHPLTEPDSLSPPRANPAPAAAPKQTAASLPALAPISAPPAAAPHTAPSGILLQIGSYKSDAEARASWQAFKSGHDAAAGYEADVKQVDLGAKGTWYRLRMGPFPDKSSALETCRKLKADGASCLLAQ